MWKKTVVSNLLAIAGAYAKATGKSLTTISKDFYGRGDFLNELKRGRKSVTIDRVDEMLTDFRDRWPAGAKWPLVRAPLMNQAPSED